ncbi:hypothetical protein DEO72_LG1g3264 [Vigna unguiculata]|uniref:Ulp1 protease family n=1 Tax=Vigna unguiculata TaxID=3917 RepID=A0A4D6KWA2_VIGUN|nr:hypothetical protein DEO72_LG1g3264 [Vigna unguiculata]
MLQEIVGKPRCQQLKVLYPKCNKQEDSWECGYYVMSWTRTIIRAAIKDEWIECNKQEDSWECGYYVMSWTRTIIRAAIKDEWIERTLPSLVSRITLLTEK